MGMFKQTVKISNPKDKELSYTGNFWVDTGALYSFIPEDILKAIHLEPIDKRNIIFADGRTETRLFGACDFEIEGLVGAIPCPVIFAPENSLLLLGATAMENFGVDADPINKRLKPILSVIGGFIASKF